MEIRRAIAHRFQKALRPNKVVLLLGPRRVGKTWFLKQLLPELGMPYLFLNGDDALVRNVFQQKTLSNFKNLVGSNKLLVIDEAQRIPAIVWGLKLMVDEIECLHVVAIGSSIFDLKNSIGEPLTGRKTDIFLYPFAQMELRPMKIWWLQNLGQPIGWCLVTTPNYGTSKVIPKKQNICWGWFHRIC